MNLKMVNTLGFYDRNELYGSPVVRNCWMPNCNYWAIFIITLISVNKYNRQTIRHPMVLAPSNIERRVWCLYLGFDCQGRRLNEFSINPIWRPNSVKNFEFASLFSTQWTQKWLAAWALIAEMSCMGPQLLEIPGSYISYVLWIANC